MGVSLCGLFNRVISPFGIVWGEATQFSFYLIDRIRSLANLVFTSIISPPNQKETFLYKELALRVSSMYEDFLEINKVNKNLQIDCSALGFRSGDLEVDLFSSIFYYGPTQSPTKKLQHISIQKEPLFDRPRPSNLPRRFREFVKLLAKSRIEDFAKSLDEKFFSIAHQPENAFIGGARAMDQVEKALNDCFWILSLSSDSKQALTRFRKDLGSFLICSNTHDSNQNSSSEKNLVPPLHPTSNKIHGSVKNFFLSDVFAPEKNATNARNLLISLKTLSGKDFDPDILLKNHSDYKETIGNLCPLFLEHSGCLSLLIGNREIQAPIAFYGTRTIDPLQSLSDAALKILSSRIVDLDQKNGNSKVGKLLKLFVAHLTEVIKGIADFEQSLNKDPLSNEENQAQEFLDKFSEKQSSLYPGHLIGKICKKKLLSINGTSSKDFVEELISLTSRNFPSVFTAEDLELIFDFVGLNSIDSQNSAGFAELLNSLFPNVLSSSFASFVSSDLTTPSFIQSLIKDKLPVLSSILRVEIFTDCLKKKIIGGFFSKDNKFIKAAYEYFVLSREEDHGQSKENLFLLVQDEVRNLNLNGVLLSPDEIESGWNHFTSFINQVNIPSRSFYPENEWKTDLESIHEKSIVAPGISERDLGIYGGLLANACIRLGAGMGWTLDVSSKLLGNKLERILGGFVAPLVSSIIKPEKPLGALAGKLRPAVSNSLNSPPQEIKQTSLEEEIAALSSLLFFKQTGLKSSMGIEKFIESNLLNIILRLTDEQWKIQVFAILIFDYVKDFLTLEKAPHLDLSA